MRLLAILLTLLPNIVFAGNMYWFERVNAELANTPGLSNVTYKPGTPHDCNFSFAMNGKAITTFVHARAGLEAVYGFTKQDGSLGVVTMKGDKLEVSDGNMFDQMTALHRRGNLAAGDGNRSVVSSDDGTQVELQSVASEGSLRLTIIKLKPIDGKLNDVQLSFSVSGVNSTEEGLSVIKVLRPIVEKQIEF